jgi:hypothetical protein
MMAGYSETPLPRKLGIAEGMRAAVLGSPRDYGSLLGGLPDKVSVASRLEGPLDFIHCFETSETALRALFPQFRQALTPKGMVWISWPKKASKMPTDIDEAKVRSAGLEAGLVDVKVCAVDEVWSGLKFVIRLKDRR